MWQNLFKYVVIALIFVLGLIVGVNLSTTAVVRAQTKNSVYVTHVKEGKKSPGNSWGSDRLFLYSGWRQPRQMLCAVTLAS